MRPAYEPEVRVKLAATPDIPPELFPSGPVVLNRSEIFHDLPVSSPGRWLHSAVMINNKMYVFGGISAYSDRLYNDLWVYDYKSSLWSQLQRSYVPPFPSGPVRPKDMPESPSMRKVPKFMRRRHTIPVVSPDYRDIPAGVGFASEQKAYTKAGVVPSPEQEQSAFVELGSTVQQSQIYDGPTMSPPAGTVPPMPLNNKPPHFRAPPNFPYELPAMNREQQRQREQYPRPLGNFPPQPDSPFKMTSFTGKNPAVSNLVGNPVMDRFKNRYRTMEQSAPKFPLSEDELRGAKNAQLHNGRPYPANQATNPAEMDWRSLIGLRPENDGLRDWPAVPVDLWEYDVDTKVWKVLVPTSEEEYPAPAPATRWLHTAVAISGRMIVFGGATVEGKIEGDTWLFNPDNVQWQRVNPKGALPLPRQGHCAGATFSSMYIFGGISYGYQPFNDLWEYNVISNQWTELSRNNPLQLPAPRWLHQCALVHNGGPKPSDARFYVFGGVTQEFVPMNDLMVFDINAKEWTKAEVVAGFAPFPRMMHNMVWMGSRLYVFGGMANNIAFEDLHYYDMHTKQWSEMLPTGSFPFARGGASAAVVIPPYRVHEGRPKYPPFTTLPSPRWNPRYHKSWADNRFMIVFGGVGAVQFN